MEWCERYRLKEQRALRPSNANMNLDKSVTGSGAVDAGMIIPARDCGPVSTLHLRGFMMKMFTNLRIGTKLAIT